MICINCGTESNLYRNLCKECFIKKYRFIEVPSVIIVSICSTCGARLKSKHWIPSENLENALFNAVTEVIKVDTEIEIPDFKIHFNLSNDPIAEAEVVSDYQYEDLSMTETYTTEIRIKYEQCDVCSKIAGSYFDSIIQVRADGRNLDEDEVEKTMSIIEKQTNAASETDKTVFISKAEMQHGGYDIYFSNQTVARQIVKSLISINGGSMNSSSTLIGRKNGKDVYRMTFLFRLPKYQQDDIVLIDDKVLLIKGISGKKVDLIDLTNWRRFTLPSKNIKDVKIIANREEYSRGQIISTSDTEMQILDLKSYKTYDVIIPQNYYDYVSSDIINEENSIEMNFIINDEIVYLIPN